jgi:hypothetical protein
MEKTRQVTHQSDAALFIVFPKRLAQSSMAGSPRYPAVTADAATKRSTATPDVTRNHEKKVGPPHYPVVHGELPSSPQQTQSQNDLRRRHQL